MQKRKSQKGFAIVESLVSIGLVTIAMVGMTSLVASSINANTASRSYASLSSEVDTIVDSYRVTPYNSLLKKFNSDFLSITNNQNIVEIVESTRSKASFTSTLTAIKGVSGSIPEQIKLRVIGTQRRAIFGNITYQFETIIAPTKF